MCLFQFLFENIQIPLIPTGAVTLDPTVSSSLPPSQKMSPSLVGTM